MNSPARTGLARFRTGSPARTRLAHFRTGSPARTELARLGTGSPARTRSWCNVTCHPSTWGRSSFSLSGTKPVSHTHTHTHTIVASMNGRRTSQHDFTCVYEIGLDYIELNWLDWTENQLPRVYLSLLAERMYPPRLPSQSCQDRSSVFWCRTAAFTVLTSFSRNRRHRENWKQHQQRRHIEVCGKHRVEE